jgi:WD40 repeat protein
MITRRGFSLGLAAAAAISADPSQPLKLERTIPLSGIRGRIDHCSADTKGGRLFLAALGNGSVEVIDWNGGKILHAITGLEEPQGVYYLAEVNRLYVATGGDGSVRMYDGSTFQLLTKVQLGSDADNIRFDPPAKSVYVGYGEGALAVLDLNGKLKARIPLSAHPESFQMERKGPRLYVNVPDSKHVAVIAREKRAVIARWNTADALANFPMALDEQGKRLFVVCRRPARMLVFDTDSGKVVQNLETVGDADDVFFELTRHQIYVSGGEGAVAVYGQSNTYDYKHRAHIVTAPGARTSLFVPNWSRLFVAVPHRVPSQPGHLLVYSVS